MSFSYNIYNKPQINHINWIKEDNRLENLEWATASENLKHAYETWLRVWPWVWKFWKDNHSSKKIIQLTTNGEFIKEWESMSLVVRELWIIQSNISSCCCWRRQTAWGFKWKFKK